MSRARRHERNAELGLLALRDGARGRVYGATVEANQLGNDHADVLGAGGAAQRRCSSALHLVVRFTAPYADPVLIPAVALINGLGVGFLRRLDLAKRDRRASSPSRASSPAPAAASSPGRWSR